MLDSLTKKNFDRYASWSFNRKIDRLSKGGSISIRIPRPVSSKPSPQSERQKILAKRKKQSQMDRLLRRSFRAKRILAQNKINQEEGLKKIKLPTGANYRKHLHSIGLL